MFNLEKMVVNTENIFDIPTVFPFTAFEDVPLHWVSFADLGRFDGVYADYGLHFFTADRDFETVWKSPDRYVPLFRQFRCIVMPDFSIYYDIPLALQIYNKYRSHWLAQYFSYKGVKVIPNISINVPQNDYILGAGYPHRSIVALSSVGSVRSPDELDILLDSVPRMIELLSPLEILHFYSSRDSLFLWDQVTNIPIKGGGFRGPRVI